MDSNEALEAVATVVWIGSGAIGSTHLHLLVSERGQTCGGREGGRQGGREGARGRDSV